MRSDAAKRGRALRTLTARIALCAMVLFMAICGCSSPGSDPMSDSGWPGAHGDAHNGNTGAIRGARVLTPAWTRNLGGPAPSGASIAPDGQVVVAANTSHGCNLFGYQMNSGRQRFCDHVELTAPTNSTSVATPLVDADDNAYIGFDSGWIHGYNEHGQELWDAQILGTAQSGVFTREGDLVVVSHMGEIRVFDRYNGKQLTAPLRLLGQPDRQATPNLGWPPNNEHLADCTDGAPSCAVATPPAIDVSSDTIFLPVWYPGRGNASLVALRYTKGSVVIPSWSADLLAGGTVSAPTLSADGTTVYAGDNTGNLMAVDASSGKLRWTYHLGFRPTGISISADGLIIPGGAGESHVLALRDRHDHAETDWTRNDLALCGVPVQTAGATGYLVARQPGDPHPSLVVINTEDGTTVAGYRLPDSSAVQPVAAQQPSAAISVGPHGEIVVAGSDGVLAAFTPK